jgi:uncharacterized protein involved in exopolysaccharide biosynthesis
MFWLNTSCIRRAARGGILDKSSTGGLTLREMIKVVRNRWRMLAISVSVFTLPAAAAAFLMTPVYRSTTLLIASETNDRSGLMSAAMGQLGGLASIAGLGFSASSQSATTEALAVLRSRIFIEEFIDKNGLMPKIFPSEWDAHTGDWKQSLTHPPTPWLAYKRFTGSVLDVYQDRKTNLITLTIDWKDREEAANWANQLVEILNARMRERATVEADQTINYLQQELRSADTVEVRSAISAMLESQLKTKAVAAVRKQYAFRVIDPAAAPDRNIVLRPHKALYILIGGAVGFFVGIAIAFLSDNRSRNRIEVATHDSSNERPISA